MMFCDIKKHFGICVCKHEFLILVQHQILSSTLGGNREIDHLYVKSQVTNLTRKTIFSPIK